MSSLWRDWARGDTQLMLARGATKYDGSSHGYLLLSTCLMMMGCISLSLLLLPIDFERDGCGSCVQYFRMVDK